MTATRKALLRAAATLAAAAAITIPATYHDMAVHPATTNTATYHDMKISPTTYHDM